MINLQNVKVKNGRTWHTICPFPVGFVYSSYTNTSPGSTFGGTWSPITGRFPYFNAGTGTGGSNTHTLTVAEIPSHTHDWRGWNWLQSPTSGDQALIVGSSNAGGSTTASGGGQPHNNMPAYQMFYAWRRTA